MSNILLISDKDAKTEFSEDLQSKIPSILEENGYRVEVYELEKDEVFQCLGCFLCLTKHPNECVDKDKVNEIRQKVKQYSATFYLTPVLFGHYSSTMASAINRGTGSHNWQVVIGYGEDIDEEERSTFIDLTAKHRGKADIVHPDMDKRVDLFLTSSNEENKKICDIIKELAQKI